MRQKFSTRKIYSIRSSISSADVMFTNPEQLGQYTKATDLSLREITVGHSRAAAVIPQSQSYILSRVAYLAIIRYFC